MRIPGVGVRWAFGIVGLAGVMGQAALLTVPAQHKTIAGALRQAEAGDTVLVAPGLYQEHLELVDEVTLLGEDREKSIIWGTPSKPVVRAASRAVIKNLTIKGGRVGIQCDNQSMVIEANVISDNMESGIHCVLSLPAIRNNLICRNKWTGVFCESGRSFKASIENNIIAENGYSGISLAGNSLVEIQNNIIFANRRFGIWVSKGSAKSRIMYNNFYENREQVNRFAVINNTNISRHPAFAALVPSSWDYLHPLAFPLEGLGREGGDIGIVSEQQLQARLVDEDRDGILSDKDKCALVAEDFDGFEDEDGCPDFDNDNDGIYDADDNCPDKAEDADGYKDSDGCPDNDNDGDGIADAQDKCPMQPETMNGFLDEDGCPDEAPQ